MVNGETKRPVVFISYAHESLEFRASVKALADWLASRECEILTDHPYAHRPPAEGWQTWMFHCINRADIVLVVCTPKLKARYEKTGAPETGFGGTYEGAIVTQRLYDAQMRNIKFFPVLPDGGAFEDIPTTLRPWSNGHRFPSGNEGIRRLIFDSPAEIGLLQSPRSEPVPNWDSHHHRLTSDLLSRPTVRPLVDALLLEFSAEFPQGAAKTIQQLVEHFAQCPAEQVQSLFYVIRRALGRLNPSDHPASVGKQIEETAAALYCLAACRLVDRENHAAGTFALQVSHGERVICAIIATALFGGELRWLPGDVQNTPRPEFVFEVKLPAAGDQILESFERAAYLALHPEERNAPEVALDSGPLPERLSRQLKARLRTIKHVKRASLALVVPGSPDRKLGRSFAEQHQVPVLFPDRETGQALLGMDPGDLLVEIREFWRELRVLPIAESIP